LNHPRFEIRIAGFGGQGIVTIGKILGTAFTVYAGKNSVNTQSYGPESRGGACRSEVVISEGEINYPYVRKADALIALSQVALDAYLDDLRQGGILIIDPDAVNSLPAAGRFRLYPVPTMTLAQETGDLKCQNSVALGALCALISHLIDEEAVLQALDETVPSQSLSRNREAFARGRDCVRAQMAGER
jgi:2-oxoglutarate ferredoxin oxidoreductase subunit gamma